MNQLNKRSGISKYQGKKFRMRKGIVAISIVLTLLALLFVSGLVITIFASKSLMSIEKKELANIPSNILPAYSHTNFTSFDEQTSLSGWFFKTESPKSTVILVHDTQKNRLQFDDATADLVEDILNDGFNVFLFDQRNSGASQGITSGYGYLEWQDVIGAIKHVRDISVTKNVILYGVGSGCSAILQAVQKLPATGEYNQEYAKNISRLPFDKSYIIGYILDSPAKNTDDYIRPIVRDTFALGFFLQYSVPFAVRMSSTGADNMNLMAEISRIPLPVCILYGDLDSFVGAGIVDQMVEERKRLQPNITSSVVFPNAGYTNAFDANSEKYRKEIRNFLTSFF